MPAPPKVRPATRDDLPEIGKALAGAFADDPVWRWMAPDSRRWLDLAR